ncbi:hypothetical protein BJX66DRAFT_336812 [Aspergillus keveii]|uniref:Uncharacterized protein n=1 Tax=Aspergillus keveii TaxID=714993 RepID=A0ABR4GA50_9EURO
MSHRIFGFLLAFSFVALSTGNPRGAVSTHYQFPHDSWLENLKTGPISSDVTTGLNISALHHVVTAHAKSSYRLDEGTVSAELIHSFPGATGALKFAKYLKFHFIVIVGNCSLNYIKPTAGS